MKSSLLKHLLLISVLTTAFHCSSTQNKKLSTTEDTILNDTIKIVNEEEEYEIIIIDSGFSFWLAGRAKPRGYYSLPFLENKNYQYVIEWNIRVNNPSRYDSTLYEMSIDYQNNVDYGYEVNYLLYNYFVYFQQTYKQRLLLSPILP